MMKKINISITTVVFILLLVSMGLIIAGAILEQDSIIIIAIAVLILLGIVNYIQQIMNKDG